MMPLLIKKDRQDIVPNDLLPATFSPETLKTNGGHSEMQKLVHVEHPLLEVII